MEGPSRRGRGPFRSSLPDCQLRGGFGTLGLAARPLHFTPVLSIARRLPEPASPGCGKIQLSRLMFHADKIASGPGLDTRLQVPPALRTDGLPQVSGTPHYSHIVYVVVENTVGAKLPSTPPESVYVN